MSTVVLDVAVAAGAAVCDGAAVCELELDAGGCDGEAVLLAGAAVLPPLAAGGDALFRL
jgi:hypothetical protein